MWYVWWCGFLERMAISQLVWQYTCISYSRMLYWDQLYTLVSIHYFNPGCHYWWSVLVYIYRGWVHYDCYLEISGSFCLIDRFGNSHEEPSDFDSTPRHMQRLWYYPDLSIPYKGIIRRLCACACTCPSEQYWPLPFGSISLWPYGLEHSLLLPL